MFHSVDHEWNYALINPIHYCIFSFLLFIFDQQIESPFLVHLQNIFKDYKKIEFVLVSNTHKIQPFPLSLSYFLLSLIKNIAISFVISFIGDTYNLKALHSIYSTGSPLKPGEYSEYIILLKWVVNYWFPLKE